MKFRSDARPSPIAGQWYSGQPGRLAQEIERYISQAQLPPINGEVAAIMAPHAGHIYSGPVAGYAFAAVRGLPVDAAAVIAPMHHPYPQPLLTSAHAAYHTPLGDAPVDQAALEYLSQTLEHSTGAPLAQVGADPEHALEIELPFLQHLYGPELPIVPVMVRDSRLATAQALGEALAGLTQPGGPLAGQRLLLVASTDLSHFYTQAVAEQLDGEMLERVRAFDPAGVIRAEEEGRGFACGRGALAAVMIAARRLGAERAILLHYATSGDVTGDYTRVVGYGAAAFVKPAPQGV